MTHEHYLAAFPPDDEIKPGTGLKRCRYNTAAGRIPARNAVALAYMAQLLAQLLEPAKAEIIALHGPAAYEKLVASAIAKDASLTPFLSGPDASLPAAPAHELETSSPTLPRDPSGGFQPQCQFEPLISRSVREVGWLSQVPPDVRG